jgi:DNA-directed RNA polymerase sigma subunit (sigma70/sigma32)
VSCRHHLYLEVDDDCGSIKFNHPDVHPDEMEKMGDTCALDVAEREEGRVGFEPKVLPLEVVGAHLGLTLERARQIEEESLLELRRRLKRRERLESEGRGLE